MSDREETVEGTADRRDKTGDARVYQNECDIVTLIVEILQIRKELEQEFFARGILQQAARSRVENRLWGWREGDLGATATIEKYRVCIIIKCRHH